MKSHATETILPANPRYHLPQADGLYQPILFAFVTQRMHQDIQAERQMILDALPSPLLQKQQRLFERYDTGASARAFQDILSLFDIPLGRR
ncbi:MAG: hypothetical protein RBT55_14775 [Rhodocyclaceae bacterium]|nr:hypothetical protein [Rhodocyclaceae bacterium]